MNHDRIASPYPLVDAPDDLITRDPDDWSLAEARAFLAWTKDAMVRRSDALLTYLGLRSGGQSPAPEEHEETLRRVGARVAEIVHEPQFWYHVERPAHPVFGTGAYSGPALTDAGHSLAADVGLLLARYVLEDLSPPVKWGIERGKSAHNRNLPILTGFKHRWADYSPFTYGRLGTEKLLERSETADQGFFAERYRKTREHVLNPDKIWT